MSTPTRWAGVPLTDRRAERRALLVDAAFRLFGDGGEAAVSVRSLCRECALNTRYFYESFADTDDLLGAVYDEVSAALAADVDAAMAGAGDTLRARTRAGIAAVLGFSSADPRRGRVLFTDARANPVLAARRAATQDLLREAVLSEGGRLNPGSDPVAAQVGAAMYTGAMAELAQQWLGGNLGDDVDVVVDYALRLVLGGGAAN
ncbi:MULTISPECIES: TetR/AcrR family transcriptional regulator [unclassified Mycolicibacterium]|uniref:TetR/AcrR family transcriptional regulator n=1 Tax=unclassified Mycolicibacterium TaxID=2636767 RepID=UPI0012DDDE8B|nr:MULTISPECIES: TetR/AcrR family transcriptional regulator [unclassified Mycolicibacterium]MUL81510.1 TetR/AcrR family transcriptional regulator [Mycolicibacterium sp. CBMA 329]MUL87276.1 TetR/AcrR family transcriptional regulator [Mycolicibacterium sp. CBMA 331]MUM02563.1 TetR/AcrR family transcriptional regulator [Mycolicibacterium sp. CBMA 334]MUM25201.1 TetR/AcrR family transcriptional regulator [Mycolicibacterium sp. CBMA 295]MUM37573.1 TetR/AcrR family transcriptional regulator [Mycolic